MNKRGAMLVTVMAAAAAFAIAPAANAAEAAAQLRCDASYNGPNLLVGCNGGASAYFQAGAEPERLQVADVLQDGRGVTAFVRASNGSLFGSVRTAGGSKETRVYVPEGRLYTLQVCLDGGICGPRYNGRA